MVFGDDSVFLQALISAGIIGGSIGVVSGIPENQNSKFRLASGIMIGVILNYLFTKHLNKDSLKIFDEYYTILREAEENVERETRTLAIREELQIIKTELEATPIESPPTNAESILVQSIAERRREELLSRQRVLNKKMEDFFFSEELPDPVFEKTYPDDPYWSNVVSGLITICLGVMAIYSVAGFLGSCRAGVVDLNGPPVQILNGNPVRVIPQPNGMQIIGASFGGRGLKDQALNTAGQLLQSTLRRTNFLERVAKRASDLAKKGLEINSHALKDCFKDFKETYVSETAQQRENLFLTNENLLLVQSPDGQDAFAVIENISAGTSATIPVIRPSRDAWNQVHGELSSRLNITPPNNQLSRFFDQQATDEDSSTSQASGGWA
jgi:hypothetical protein